MKPPVRGIAAAIGTLALLTGCSSATESSTDVSESSSEPTSVAPAGATDIGPVVATPVLGRVLAPPVPVTASDGKVHLAYELYLTNAVSQDVNVESVTVKAGDENLLTLSGAELTAQTRILGATNLPTTEFGPAQSGLVWVDIELPDGAQVPQELSHTVVVSMTEPMPPIMPATLAEEIATVTVSTRKPAVIASPLDGPNWLAANSCCDLMTSHRMAVNPINGEVWAAERFAIDYLQLSEDGTIFSGDGTKNESYPYFGADIRAVADGPVVSVLDGLPEQIAGTAPTGLALQEYGGNHVVQDIGDGNYAFYAHLQTGSAKVKPGDRLTTGQVLGNLGNSGNTDAPHLHFHVMSGPDPLMADGLPFVFESFELDGRLASNDALGPLLEGKPADLQPDFPARGETMVSPLVLDVMSYDLD